MNLSIQPLDSHGQPTGEPILTTWADFITANDGFDIATLAEMHAVLLLGSGYRLGGGAMGEFRLVRIP